MSFRNQIIVIALTFFLSFCDIRHFLWGVKRYQLNNSAYKKRKKGESFKEWLFYIRYTKEIPKILRLLYYTVLLIHPISLIVCVFLYFIKIPFVGGVIAITVAGVDAVWMLAIALLFWTPGSDYAYERWILQQRGQKRGKK